MLKKTLLLAGLLSLAGVVHAHQYDAGDLHIDHPWSREAPPTAPTLAAYFIVHNHGATADRLLGADTPAAGRAEFHQNAMKDGMTSMTAVQSVEIPAGGEARFEPMGYHVMLLDLKQHPRDGERFPMTLHFEKAGDVLVQVAVQKEAPGEHDAKGVDMHDMKGMKGMDMK